MQAADVVETPRTCFVADSVSTVSAQRPGVGARLICAPENEAKS